MDGLLLRGRVHEHDIRAEGRVGRNLENLGLGGGSVMVELHSKKYSDIIRLEQACPSDSDHQESNTIGSAM